MHMFPVLVYRVFAHNHSVVIVKQITSRPSMTGVVAESLGVGPAHLDGWGIQVSRHPNIFPVSPAASLNGPGK